ncbi:MAG TPA: DUF1460 domain-containing protein [Ignavibacteria bacterium]|nr:DUF1460 domain-containing protein [Ignavibacteria bacterium]HMR40661.1 DUF1460 domain-containing protein [Ignavibacteria bacterium]
MNSKKKFKLFYILIIFSFFICFISEVSSKPVKIFSDLTNSTNSYISGFPENSEYKIPSDVADDYEKMKCNKKIKSFDASLKSLPMNELIIEVGKTFIGTPYVGGTLDENPNTEEVVIKITGLDCVTYVENALTFSIMIKEGKNTIEDYREVLERVRYRDGKNTGYPSRLHYFSDWIYNNEQKGLVKDITKEIGGIPYNKNIDFMTTHTNSYKQLANDPGAVNAMIEVEDNINSREIYYIPKEDISLVYDKLENGDIIGITSTISGLDVAHTGYVYKENGIAYLLNASLKDKQVEISPMDLQDYLMGNSKQGGIIVARVTDIK